MTTYLDDTAAVIRSGLPEEFDCAEGLLRLYALLLHSKGVAVTLADVHDAWAVWVQETYGEHRSLVPFDHLRPDVQALDEPFVEAIRRTATRMASAAENALDEGARLRSERCVHRSRKNTVSDAADPRAAAAPCSRRAGADTARGEVTPPLSPRPAAQGQHPCPGAAPPEHASRAAARRRRSTPPAQE